MGLTAIPFAIEIEKIKAVFGCKDKEFLERIKGTNLYETYAADDYFPSPESRFNFDDALADLLFNYIPLSERKPAKKNFFGFGKPIQNTGLDETKPHAYGYVLLVICDYLGTHLLPECDGFRYGSDFKEAFKILKNHGLQLNLADMFESNGVFDLPKNSDFPGIYHFARKEIAEFNNVMKNIEISGSLAPNNEDLDEVNEMLLNLRNSFKYCEDHDLEMITFTH